MQGAGSPLPKECFQPETPVVSKMHSSTRVATGAVFQLIFPALQPPLRHGNNEYGLLTQPMEPITSRSSQWLSWLCSTVTNRLDDENEQKSMNTEVLMPLNFDFWRVHLVNVPDFDGHFNMSIWLHKRCCCGPC